MGEKDSTRTRGWGFSRPRPSSAEETSRVLSSPRPTPMDDIPTILEDSPVLQPIASPSTPQKKLWERSYRNYLKSNGGRAAPALPLDTTRSKEPPRTPTRGGGESSVRGGKFFSGIFQNGSKAHPSRRRVKSTDELDDTMRRGIDKAHSPRANPPPRHVRSVSDYGMLARPVPVPKPCMRVQSDSTAPQLDEQTVDMELVKSLQIAQREESIDSMIDSSLSSTPPLNIGRPIVDIVDPFGDPSTSQKRRAFTRFHNVHDRDSNSAYLGGEDSSVREQGLMGLLQQKPLHASTWHDSMPKFPTEKLPSNLSENVTIEANRRMLKPIQGVESWKPGRRYLIAPAVLTACPMTVLSVFSRSNKMFPPAEALRSSPFAAVDLGECLVSYVDRTPSMTKIWSSCRLILRQNYLLEYSVEGSLHTPRGYAQLQYATCENSHYFKDALELHFYASPCARADDRVLTIRPAAKDQCNLWRDCLNRAANLQIKDLYEYSPGQSLGRGQYATVHPGRRRDEERACALKIFDKKAFWKLVVKGKERADTLVREASVQATLTAKSTSVGSFLKLLGFFETSEHVVLELELLEGKDLFQHICSKGTLSEQEAAQTTHELLEALDAMNRFGLAHRDIKPANILMCRATDTTRVKLCDFGMAAFCDVDGQVRGRCGTPGYVAPEIFTAGIHGGYRNTVDLFSTGVTLYVMLCGYEPFYGETDAELVEANKNGVCDFPAEDWAKISKPAKELVRQMMHVDPTQRPSTHDALQHPWILKHVKVKTPPPATSPQDNTCTIS